MKCINRRDFIKTSASVSLGGSLLCGCSEKKERKGKRPNIIFLLTDDQRNDMLGCTGHPILKTPVIDSLAKNGVFFRNAFVTTSICAASRASILTGTYERTHQYTFNKPPVHKAIARNNYPQILRDAGYKTGFYGKFGCELETEKEDMFDDYKEIDRNPYFHEMPDGSKRHETDLCADNAIDFIKSQSIRAPFCLSVSFNAPHAEDADLRPGIGHFPWPPSSDGMYKNTYIPKPKLSCPDIFEMHPDFLKESLNRIRYDWRWNTPEKYQTNMQAYFRMISGIDNAVGRIIKTLQDKGMEDNTVIIYCADNGFYLGERGFAGKWSHYDESIRIPLIIYDPRLPKQRQGCTINNFALNVDIPSTILDIAQTHIPTTYQGKSLLRLMYGEKEVDWRDDFFCEHLLKHESIPKWEGIRGKRFMYSRYFEQKPVYEFLHDLQEDPDQLTNFASCEEYQPILQKMKSRCDELKSKYSMCQSFI